MFEHLPYAGEIALVEKESGVFLLRGPGLERGGFREPGEDRETRRREACCPEKIAS
jgi:hypothetical protein